MSTETKEFKLRVKKKNVYTDPAGNQISAKYMREDNILRDFVSTELVTKAIQLQQQLKEFKALGKKMLKAYKARYTKLNKVNEENWVGNIAASSFDGTKKVEIDAHPFTEYGEGLKIANGLMRDVLEDNTSNIEPVIQELVLDAFTTDKKGRVNPSKVENLCNYDVPDNRWRKAVKIIQSDKSIKYRKEYIRFSIREPKGEWKSILLDIAKL